MFKCFFVFFIIKNSIYKKTSDWRFVAISYQAIKRQSLVKLSVTDFTDMEREPGFSGLGWLHTFKNLDCLQILKSVQQGVNFHFLLVIG